MALSAAILFAIEIDNINRSFIVTRGISFYLQVSINKKCVNVCVKKKKLIKSFFQILLVILSIALVVVALYDVIFTLRVSGDPTKCEVTVASATTINNPGYRETRSGKNCKIFSIVKCISSCFNFQVYP